MPDDALWGTAAIVIAICCFVQMLNTWFTAVTLSVLTAIKMLLVLIICMLGIWHAGIMRKGSNQLAIENSFEGTDERPGEWVLAFVVPSFFL